MKATSQRRFIAGGVIAAAAIGLTAGLIAPASSPHVTLAAALSPAPQAAQPAAAARSGETTYDRPGVAALADGEAEVAWDSTDEAGTVNVAVFAKSGTEGGGKFTDKNSSTFSGTGPKVALDADQNVVVAWTDAGQRVHLAEISGGFVCENSHASVTSVDSPYLTLAADGVLYLTTVDAAGVISVGAVDDSACQGHGGLVTVGPMATVPGASTAEGPALVDLNPYHAGAVGRPELLLAWADRTSSAIRLALYDPAADSLGLPFSGPSATTTDLGAGSLTAGTASVTFCSTDGAISSMAVQGAAVVGGAGGPGGTCIVHPTPNGYISGGIDTSGSFTAYADPGENLVVVG